MTQYDNSLKIWMKIVGVAWVTVFLGIFGMFIYMLFFKKKTLNAPVCRRGEKTVEGKGKADEGLSLLLKEDEGGREERKQEAEKPVVIQSMDKPKTALDRLDLSDNKNKVGSPRLAGSGDTGRRASTVPVMVADSSCEIREENPRAFEKLVGLAELAKLKLLRNGPSERPPQLSTSDSHTVRDVGPDHQDKTQLCPVTVWNSSAQSKPSSCLLSKLDSSKIYRRVLPPDPIINNRVELDQSGDSYVFNHSENKNEEMPVPSLNCNSEKGHSKNQEKDSEKEEEGNLLLKNYLKEYNTEANQSKVSKETFRVQTETSYKSRIDRKYNDKKKEGGSEGTNFQDVLFEPSKSKIFNSNISFSPLCELTGEKLLKTTFETHKGEGDSETQQEKIDFDSKRGLHGFGDTKENNEDLRSGTKSANPPNRYVFPDPVLMLTETLDHYDPTTTTPQPKPCNHFAPQFRQQESLIKQTAPPSDETLGLRSIKKDRDINGGRSTLFRKQDLDEQILGRAKSVEQIAGGDPEETFVPPPPPFKAKIMSTEYDVLCPSLQNSLKESKPDLASKDVMENIKLTRKNCISQEFSAEENIEQVESEKVKPGREGGEAMVESGNFQVSRISSTDKINEISASPSCVRVSDVGCHRRKDLTVACLQRRRSHEGGAKLKKSCRHSEETMNQICPACLNHMNASCSDCHRPLHASCLECQRPLVGTCKKGFRVFRKFSPTSHDF